VTRSILALSMTALCFIATLAAEPQSFPLVCRGGPGMRTMAHAGNTEHTFNILGLFFTPGSRRAGPKGKDLQPGQCSWVDRGFREGEPSILQERVGPNVTRAAWFADMKNPDKVWIFSVFNTNQGVMQITHAIAADAIDDGENPDTSAGSHVR